MGTVLYIPTQDQIVTATATINANNTTASVTLWTLTGSIKVKRIYGVVTTVLSANHTAAHWRMNDGTNTPVITLAAGTTLSAANVGSLISKAGLVGAALILNKADQTRVAEHATSGLDPDVPFDLVAKNGATTTIEYRYTTTDAPASGVIQMFCVYTPLSFDGSLS